MLPADELRGFIARLLGWTRERAVDDALRSIKLAAAYRAQLVLYGAGDLVPIAYALHRRTLGAARPFIVCDPHRRNTPASLRAPANHASRVAAFKAAAGGALRVRGRMLPHDFPSLVGLLRSTDTAHVCNGRLLLDELTDLPEGTHLELVSVDDVLSNGGDLLDAEERAELGQDLEASFAEEEAGQLIDDADALADLRTRR